MIEEFETILTIGAVIVAITGWLWKLHGLSLYNSKTIQDHNQLIKKLTETLNGISSKIIHYDIAHSTYNQIIGPEALEKKQTQITNMSTRINALEDKTKELATRIRELEKISKG